MKITAATAVLTTALRASDRLLLLLATARQTVKLPRTPPQTGH